MIHELNNVDEILETAAGRGRLLDDDPEYRPEYEGETPLWVGDPSMEPWYVPGQGACYPRATGIWRV